MNAPWNPRHLLCDARTENRHAVPGLDEDSAAVAAHLARMGGHNTAFTVAHIGLTTRPQHIIWPMRLTPEKEH